MRPAINTAGLPESIRARVAAKAAALWCYTTEDGRPFYVSKQAAHAMRDKNGGKVYAPDTWGAAVLAVGPL